MIFSSTSLSLSSVSHSLTLPAVYSGFTFATPARYKEDPLFSLSLRRERENRGEAFVLPPLSPLSFPSFYIHRLLLVEHPLSPHHTAPRHLHIPTLVGIISERLSLARRAIRAMLARGRLRQFCVSLARQTTAPADSLSWTRQAYTKGGGGQATPPSHAPRRPKDKQFNNDKRPTRTPWPTKGGYKSTPTTNNRRPERPPLQLRRPVCLRKPILPLVDAQGPPGLLLWLRGQEQRETDFAHAFPDAFTGATQWRLLCVSRMTKHGRQADILTASSVAGLAEELLNASQGLIRIPVSVIERLTWQDDEANLRQATLLFEDALTLFDVFDNPETRASLGTEQQLSSRQADRDAGPELATISWHRLTVLPAPSADGAHLNNREDDADGVPAPSSEASMKEPPQEEAKQRGKNRPERMARERVVASLQNGASKEAGELALSPRLSNALLRQAGVFGLRFQSSKTPALSLAALPAWTLTGETCPDSKQLFYSPTRTSRWLEHDEDVQATFDDIANKVASEGGGEQ